jgi:hypothetical protein
MLRFIVFICSIISILNLTMSLGLPIGILIILTVFILIGIVDACHK